MLDVEEVTALTRATSGERFPLASQLQAAEELTRHGRLVARLPTGAGKTLLAALPFAAGLLRPRQMVFMTPLRTLTSAQTQALRDGIDAEAATAAIGTPWSVREQTGTVPEDPLFTAPATVCTFDQALSAAAQISYSTSARRRTINAGAILSAYLVADELHLFPRDEALTTLLWLLRHRPELPCCLMTATLSAPMAARLGALLDAPVLDQLPPEDAALLQVADRTRTVQWQPTPSTAEQIARLAVTHDRVLVVVNTVDRAIALGRDVARLVPDRPVRVLHGRFYRRDRDRITGQVLGALGRAPHTRRPAVTIATQVVEAGLDISAEVLVTELAPANALVQRWGRCARWGGAGHVIVAPPTKEPVYPYVAEDDGAALLTGTRDWLAEHAASPLAVDAVTEQAFLDAVHAGPDTAWLDRLERGLVDRSGTIARAIQAGDYSLAGTLIRHVEQRTVLVHGHPEQLGNPARQEGFGLAFGTIAGLARAAGIMGNRAHHRPDPVPSDEDAISFALPEPPVWSLQVPVWDRAADGSERRADEPTGWVPVTSLNELQAAPVVAVNPALVQYDRSFGLELSPGPGPVASTCWAHPVEPRQRGASFEPYRRETLAEHVGVMLRVLDQHPALWPRTAPVATALDGWLDWPPGTLRRVVRAAIVLHDAGKLTPGWQAGIRAIQRRAGQPSLPWLVHSDGDPRERAGLPALPPHARSGAAHALALAAALDGEVAARSGVPGQEVPSPGRVLFTAIATHHSPTAHDLLVRCEDLLDAAGRQEVARLLACYELPDDVPPLAEGEELSACLVPLAALAQPVVAREALALAIVSRLLRLADGWSQEAVGPGPTARIATGGDVA